MVMKKLDWLQELNLCYMLLYCKIAMLFTCDFDVTLEEHYTKMRSSKCNNIFSLINPEDKWVQIGLNLQGTSRKERRDVLSLRRLSFRFVDEKVCEKCLKRYCFGNILHSICLNLQGILSFLHSSGSCSIYRYYSEDSGIRRYNDMRSGRQVSFLHMSSLKSKTEIWADDTFFLNRVLRRGLSSNRMTLW